MNRNSTDLLFFPVGSKTHPDGIIESESESACPYFKHNGQT